MCLECGDFFMSVVVEDPQLEVVRASNEPVLARNETDTSNRNFSDFKRLHQRCSFVIVDVDCAIIETGK